VTVPRGMEATAEDGNLTLSGTVGYGTERVAAEAAVAGLAGVRNVTDDIEVSYLLDPVDVDLHVQQALERCALVPDGSDVTAQVKDGVITLSGQVRPGPSMTRCWTPPGWPRASSRSATTSRSPADPDRPAVALLNTNVIFVSYHQS
jgi:hypothetical protein